MRTIRIVIKGGGSIEYPAQDGYDIARLWNEISMQKQMLFAIGGNQVLLPSENVAYICNEEGPTHGAPEMTQ